MLVSSALVVGQGPPLAHRSSPARATALLAGLPWRARVGASAPAYAAPLSAAGASIPHRTPRRGVLRLAPAASRPQTTPTPPGARRRRLDARTAHTPSTSQPARRRGSRSGRARGRADVGADAGAQSPRPWASPRASRSPEASATGGRPRPPPRPPAAPAPAPSGGASRGRTPRGRQGTTRLLASHAQGTGRPEAGRGAQPRGGACSIGSHGVRAGGRVVPRVGAVRATVAGAAPPR